MKEKCHLENFAEKNRGIFDKGGMKDKWGRIQTTTFNPMHHKNRQKKKYELKLGHKFC